MQQKLGTTLLWLHEPDKNGDRRKEDVHCQHA